MMDLKLFDKVFVKYEINTDLRRAHFLAQIHHESEGLKSLIENLNYSSGGLLRTFSRSRISHYQANLYGRTFNQKANQEMIANIVYGGRFGKYNLGNTEFGDGWKYRGRGPLQCTGKANYQAYMNYSGIDVISNPELMSSIEVGLDFAGYFWSKNRLNKLADKNDIRGITKKINGGSNGLEDRIKLFNEYKKLINESR
jgi:putative chitinase